LLAEPEALEDVATAEDVVVSLPLAATGTPPPRLQPIDASAITAAVAAASRQPRVALVRTTRV
jgi:hypothetical protein